MHLTLCDLLGMLVFFSGAIFDQNVNLNTQILNHAVEQANSNILFDSGVELKPGVANIEYGNVFQAAETVCDLLTVSAVNSQIFSRLSQYRNGYTYYVISLFCLYFGNRKNRMQFSLQNHRQLQLTLQAFVM